jgi:osmotically-inducible protein OsmY
LPTGPLHHCKIFLQYKLKGMKSNSELQKDVRDAIKWEPLLNAAEIGVTVKNGVVSLTGEVDSYTKKNGGRRCG